MKSFFLLIPVLFVSVLAIGQDLPRTEFNASLSENVIPIKPGETKSLTVSIIRSKAWTKSVATLSIPAALPEGIIISFEPAEGLFTESKMIIEIAPDVKAGVHTIMVRSEVRHKKKGNLLRIEVDNTSTAITGINN